MIRDDASDDAAAADAAIPPDFSVNQARSLFDGAAYREMVAMVSRARKSVRLEFFLFGGPVANTIITILGDKITYGVRVEVTLDSARGILPQVRRECRAAYRHLRRQHIDVVLGAPYRFPDSSGDRPAIRHNKIVVVDEEEALVGGMNIGTLFFRHHDVMIHLRGPAATALAQQFDQDRRLLKEPRPVLRPVGVTPSSPPSPLLPFPHAPGASAASATAALAGNESWVRLLSTGIGRRVTRQAILQNLGAARSSVWVAMSEIGRTDVLNEVIAAKERGVEVRVLVDPQDMGEYLPATLGFLRKRWYPRGVLNAGAVRVLLDAGVSVRLYRVGADQDFALLHLKMAIFDSWSAIAGSSNWTRSGFEWVVETDVELHGGPVIGELMAQFATDWETALPATVPPRAVQALCSLYERLYQ